MMDDFIHSTCSIPWGCQDSDETKTASANSSPGPQALHQNQPALQSLCSLPWEARWCTGMRCYRNPYAARWALTELETVSSKTYRNSEDALPNLAKLISDSAVKAPNKQIPTILFLQLPVSSSRSSSAVLGFGFFYARETSVILVLLEWRTVSASKRGRKLQSHAVSHRWSHTLASQQVLSVVKGHL